MSSPFDDCCLPGNALIRGGACVEGESGPTRGDQLATPPLAEKTAKECKPKLSPKTGKGKPCPAGCSGNGVGHFGQCFWDPGFTGADCGKPASDDDDRFAAAKVTGESVGVGP